MSILDTLLQKLGSTAQNAVTTGINKVSSGISTGIDSLVSGAKRKASIRKKNVTFRTLPQNVEEMKAMPAYDPKNEFAVAAFTVAALLRYTNAPGDGREMLDELNGPENVAIIDLQRMDEKIVGNEYMLRSYFKGASTSNDYAPTLPYTVEIWEYPNAREIDNYVYLYIPSGGADNPRQVQLRRKPSTGEWFIWSFQGLLMDIRIPASADKWS